MFGLYFFVVGLIVDVIGVVVGCSRSFLASCCGIGWTVVLQWMG